MDAQVLTLSSKGQVALPINMRRKLSIDTGDKLVCYISGDVILLKAIKLPSISDFEKAMDDARDWAAAVGYKEEDVNDIVKSVRKKK